MDDRDSRDQMEDEFVWGALREIGKISSEPLNSFETEVERLRTTLLSSEPLEHPPADVIHRQSPAPVLTIAGEERIGIEGILVWLQNTKALTKREIEFIREVRLFSEDENGSISIRSFGISKSVALLGMASIFLLAATWLIWIVLVDSVGIAGIALSYSLGGFLGMSGRKLFDRTYAFMRMKEKISLIAPWHFPHSRNNF